MALDVPFWNGALYGSHRLLRGQSRTIDPGSLCYAVNLFELGTGFWVKQLPFCQSD